MYFTTTLSCLLAVTGEKQSETSSPDARRKRLGRQGLRPLSPPSPFPVPSSPSNPVCRSLPFPIPTFPPLPLEVVPLNPARGSGSAVSSPGGGRAPAEVEFGVF